jgi:DNA-binding transcriptional regulator YiaG
MEGEKHMDKNSLRNILVELRGATNWTQKEFAEYFDIPRRTLEDWEIGARGMPEYLLRLMVYKLENENVVENFSNKFIKSE